MSIKATCGQCQASFKAPDKLAGKKVKCPKCGKGLTIPAATAAAASSARRPARKVLDPMEALLDEANVKAPTTGPICPDCGMPISPGAKICIDCGYNLETERRMKTISGNDEDDSIADSGMTDADKIMQKAEDEINETALDADEMDFGDGKESFVIAAVAGGILLALLVASMIIILSMEWFSQFTNPGAISMVASFGLYLAMAVWITVVAFKVSPIHGIGSIVTLGAWCIVFGFMQGKNLIVPTVILLATLVIGSASGVYVMYNGLGHVDAT